MAVCRTPAPPQLNHGHRAVPPKEYISTIAATGRAPQDTKGVPFGGRPHESLTAPYLRVYLWRACGAC